MLRYVLGNWKMNMSVAEIADFEANFVAENTPNVSIGIAVPAIYWGNCAGLRGKALLGLQNVSEFDNGAYTGEISAQMAKDVGAEFCIVGHSERRKYFGETDERVNQKIAQLQSVGVRPVLCVGETLAQYEAGETKAVLASQLTDGLRGVNVDEVIVAYEPVWAIGTGKSASIEIIEDICGYIAEFLTTLSSKKVPVLYGGSVNNTNADDIAKLDTVSGVLVGGASMDVAKFLAIKKAFS